MNRYDELFNFRMATVDDIDAIMEYIEYNWREDHILAVNRDFFIWMYGNSCFNDDQTVNFVLMEDKNGNIKGLNGFVVYSNERGRLDVSSAITKVSADVEVPFAGVELIKRFHDIVGARRYYSYGTNPDTMLPLGKRIFKYDTGLVSQYYMLNPEITDYKIAEIRNKAVSGVQRDDSRLIEAKDIETIDQYFSYSDYNNQGYKSREFLKHRYFDHPVYKYEAYLVEKNGTIIPDFVMIGRTMIVNGSTAFRIVDVLGNLDSLCDVSGAVYSFIIEKGHEYADLVCCGMDQNVMEKAGFVLRMEDENVIPHYFEPFERKNINLWYQKSDNDVVIFKADGDQDRPNKI